jgi:PAB-dependent poly(A)-specific ribonuclease subunit 2
MFRIDVEKGTLVETLTSETNVPYTLMRYTGQIICAAAHDGSIHLIDPKTLAVVHSWKAYAGPVSDMDARGDYLLTCGWAQMQYQGLALERLVRVYDLKSQKPAPPVPFQQGAAHVRMHPRLSSTCIVVSQSGLIHSIDIQNPDMPSMRYVNSFDVQFTGLEIMPSGKGFALADNNNHVILWGSPAKLQFTEYSQPTEFAEQAASSRRLDWATDTPLNLIGMSYYREALLSSWPNSLLHQVGLPTPRMEPLDNSFRVFEYGRVGVNPRKTRRYQAPNTKLNQKTSDPLAAPKFLSEKPREEDGNPETRRRMSEDLLKALDGLKLDGKAGSDAKFLYRNVEIKYSRFGVEDFDFRYYNKTQYAGLETHIINSYANPLLQILRFTPVARNLALHHTARDCRLESCLFCELGFLTDMLEKAKAPNCHATNFLKALSRQPDAPAQNILEEATTGVSLTVMMQNLNRFLLQRLEDNFKWIAPSLDHYHLALGTIGLDYTQCTHCSYESRLDKVWYTHDLVYPPRPPKHRNMRQYFSQVLKASIERHSQHRGWCLRCNGYKGMVSHRAIHCLPAVLMLNAAVSTPESKHLWGTPGLLPREIGVIVNNGRFFCYEGQDLQLHLQRGQFNITVYELVGVIAEVRTSEHEKSHLVATVDVGLSQPDSSQKANWHLFNDFLVHKLPPEEALHFNPQWKLPSVITYQVKTMSHVIDDGWKAAIDTSILYRSPTQPPSSAAYQFRPLSESEPLPNNESHVAIDAEFVRLVREEIDVGADGSRIMTRPARSGLARVSVLRGDGHDQELPFIDDYIAIDEPIDDHLTQYSGLHDGDLTVGRSRFKLVSLKEVYKKLWVLLNLGCSFIGHGLSSDLRIINIHVPDSQIIDTQDLFSLGSRTRRKLSLRFLAWTVLQEEIQHDADRGHDSIEDARSALKLWRKYLEYDNAGVLETIKDELLHKGRATDFKVPDSKRSPPASLPSTPQRAPVRMATPAVVARSDYGSPRR